MKEKTLDQQIKAKVREGRAPPCAVCGAGGSIAGKDLGPVFCATCGASFQSLANAWKCSLRRSAENPGVKWWL